SFAALGSAFGDRSSAGNLRGSDLSCFSRAVPILTALDSAPARGVHVCPGRTLAEAAVKINANSFNLIMPLSVIYTPSTGCCPGGLEGGLERLSASLAN